MSRLQRPLARLTMVSAFARVDRFVEKPDAATAETYIASGDYRWNSGIFTWRADVVLEALGQAHSVADGMP